MVFFVEVYDDVQFLLKWQALKGQKVYNQLAVTRLEVFVYIQLGHFSLVLTNFMFSLYCFGQIYALLTRNLQGTCRQTSLTRIFLQAICYDILERLIQANKLLSKDVIFYLILLFSQRSLQEQRRSIKQQFHDNAPKRPEIPSHHTCQIQLSTSLIELPQHLRRIIRSAETIRFELALQLKGRKVQMILIINHNAPRIQPSISLSFLMQAIQQDFDLTYKPFPFLFPQLLLVQILKQIAESPSTHLQLRLDDIKVQLLAFLNNKHVISQHDPTLVQAIERLEAVEIFQGEFLLDEPDPLVCVLYLSDKGIFAGFVIFDDLIVRQKLVIVQHVFQDLPPWGVAFLHVVIYII